MGKNTRTILICSGKGGVGKTTLTANLGIALANSGASTAVLDADFGLRNLDLLLGLENRIIYTAQDVLDNNCRLDQALVCLLYTSPSPRDRTRARMPSSA